MAAVRAEAGRARVVALGAPQVVTDRPHDERDVPGSGGAELGIGAFGDDVAFRDRDGLGDQAAIVGHPHEPLREPAVLTQV